MLKKIALILMIFPLTAFATYRNDDQPTQQTPSVRITNDLYSASKSKAYALSASISKSAAFAQGGNASASGGNSSSGSSASNGNNTVTTQFNQVRQTPFAYSPGLAQSFSQDNCANSASLGVSAGFGAIGGGAPIESDSCNRRKDVALWLATGQNRIACERMTDDEENLAAMKRAGLDCSKLTSQNVAVVSQPVKGSNFPTNDQWDRMQQLREAQFNAIMAKRRHK